MKREIILASSSPRRISLLKEWGFIFKAVPSGADENIDLKKPSSIVKELAYRKADYIAPKYPQALIISADTIVVLKGKIIGKPKDKKEAESIIRDLNGSLHRVYTGVAIIDNLLNKKSVFYDYASVKMKNLPDNELEKFFGKHMDKAGAYAVQDKNDKFVDKVYGDYYTVVGLPYTKLIEELKDFNIIIK